MRSIRVQAIFQFLLIIMVSIISGISMADNDTNDSLDDPEIITEGTANGRVDDHYTGEYPNYTAVRDDDIYRVSIPPGTECEFRLKMIGEDSEYIRGTGYDHEKIEVDYGFHLYATVPGEVSIDTWTNDDENPMDFHVLVSGEGNYSLTVSFSNLEDEDEEKEGDEITQFHQYYDRPQVVDDGVYSNKFPIDDIIFDIDTWYYLVSVNGWHYLKVNFEKTDAEPGALYLRSMDPDLEATNYESIDIVVDREGQNESGRWFNPYSYEDRILLKVQGKGQYKLILDTTSEGSILDSELYMILLGTIIGSICIVLIFIMIPVCIFLIIAIAMMRQSRKRKKKMSNQNSTFS